ncbi:MAG: hemolysin family protein [bacterium]|nr:hemolysin family protein [bacterium]
MPETGSLPPQPGIAHLAGIIICFFLVFIFSGLEAGLLSLNKIWLSEQVADGNRRARILQNILNTPSKLLSVMLTMETTCSVVLAVLWTIIGVWGIHVYHLHAWFHGLWYALLILILVMFCEILPKSIFASNAERITIKLAPFANLLIKIVYPIAFVLEGISRLLIRVTTGKWLKPRKSKVTEEDLITMVSVGEDEGVLEEQEMEMIHSIFEFGDRTAREIMVPRVDMVALDLEDSVEDALKIIVEHGHSRIPVFEESPDHIKGLLFAKDLLRHMEQGDLGKLSIGELVRPNTLFVPGTKDLTSLLEEMRLRKAHFAIVMDEYGGTDGLITIEDILEEIVGDIQDEYDKPLERLVEKCDDGTFIIDSKLALHDFDDEIGVELPDYDGIETVGGLLYQILGRIPEVGEEIPITPIPKNGNGDFVTDDPIYGLITFKVLEVEENRIGRVKVSLEVIQRPEQSPANGHDKGGE